MVMPINDNMAKISAITTTCIELITNPMMDKIKKEKAKQQKQDEIAIRILVETLPSKQTFSNVASMIFDI